MKLNVDVDVFFTTVLLQTIFRTISVKIQTTRFEGVGKKRGGGVYSKGAFIK